MSQVQNIKDEIKLFSPILCRICATEQDDCMNNLLTSIHNGLYFIDMLQYCLQRPIDKDNRLPLNICLDCTSNLIVAYNFNVLINGSEQRFRNLLGCDMKCDTLEQKVEVVIDEPENDVKESVFIDCTAIVISNGNCDKIDMESRRVTEIDKVESKTHSKLNRSKASRINNRIQNYECYRCKLNFRRMVYLRQHMTYHYPDEELWKCTHCSHRFTLRKNLLKHLYKHTNASCEYCPEKFTTLRDLKQHCLTTHTEQLIIRKCDLCPRKFILNSQLVIHMHNHDRTQRYHCNVCSETFASEMQLKGHTRAVHTAYLCSECGKTFKNNSLLTSHQKVHNSDKPFVCTKCPSRFKWKVALT